jgi:hypothetical protein
MEIRWRTLLTQTIISVAVEMLLGSQGQDSMADYAEFILHRNTIALSQLV